jgi:hypothetical protein
MSGLWTDPEFIVWLYHNYKLRGVHYIIGLEQSKIYNELKTCMSFFTLFIQQHIPILCHQSISEHLVA